MVALADSVTEGHKGGFSLVLLISSFIFWEQQQQIVNKLTIITNMLRESWKNNKFVFRVHQFLPFDYSSFLGSLCPRNQCLCPLVCWKNKKIRKNILQCSQWACNWSLCIVCLIWWQTTKKICWNVVVPFMYHLLIYINDHHQHHHLLQQHVSISIVYSLCSKPEHGTVSLFTFLNLSVLTQRFALDLKGWVWVKALHLVHWGSLPNLPKAKGQL